jgi:hypothetical protein
MEVLDTLDIDQVDRGDVIAFPAADPETEEEFLEVMEVTENVHWEDMWRLTGHSLRADIEVKYYRFDSAQVSLVSL